jgi:hypothetical protein
MLVLKYNFPITYMLQYCVSFILRESLVLHTVHYATVVVNYAQIGIDFLELTFFTCFQTFQVCRLDIWYRSAFWSYPDSELDDENGCMINGQSGNPVHP